MFLGDAEALLARLYRIYYADDFSFVYFHNNFNDLREKLKIYSQHLEDNQELISADKYLRKYIQDYAKTDQRIKIEQRSFKKQSNESKSN